MTSKAALAGWLVAGAALLLLPPAQAAKHRRGPVHSLLPACQGTAAPPSPDCGLTPAPAFDRQGRLWLAFVQRAHLYLTHSDDLGQHFATPVRVNPIPEAIYHDGENRPKLALGPRGEIYLSWSQKAAGRFSGHIRFSRSLDGGKSFSPPQTVNDDPAPIGHRFDSLAVDRQGRIHIVWVDKRDRVRARKSGKTYRGAAIYRALSEDRGRSFRFNRKLADHSCECCRIALATPADGPVTALWRHIYPDNIRDHAIARLGAGPATAAPVRATDDRWQVEGCPHHGPDLALGDDQKAHMIWFTGGGKSRGIRYGRFDLRRGELERNQTLDSASTASRPQIATLSGRLVAVWKSFNGETSELRIRDSRDNGDHWSAPRTLATTADGSDYPILLQRGKRLFASWHTRREGYRLIEITPNAS